MPVKRRKDYYRVLQVSPDASSEEIKQAYRRLARQYHPDLNPGDREAEARFKEINEAYEVLSDPRARQVYDRATRAPGFVYEEPTWAVAHDPLDELLDALFGRRPTVQRRSQAASRGRTYEAEITLTLEEAFYGTRRQLTVEGRRVPVQVPPGVRDGTTLRLSGAGGRSAYGGVAGDLLLRIRVQPHPQYTVQNNDIITDAEVDLFTALLGGTITVDTLEGPLQVHIRPETQGDSMLRIPGRGMPDPAHPEKRGDFLIRLRVVLPTGLSEEERDLVRQFARLRGERTSEDYEEQ